MRGPGPASANELVEQVKHDDDEDGYMPTPHVELHDVDPTADRVPAAHVPHTVEEVAPVEEDAVPAAHRTQEADPAALRYVPAGQEAEHADAPGPETWPLEQAVHDELPAEA